MKFPLSWLLEYVEGSVSFSQIEKALIKLGLEVEHIEQKPPSFEGVVIALVESVKPHPSASNLQLAKVFDGEKRFNVVCGAPNCREGLLSAFAPIGASITVDGKRVKIKKSTLRGEVSEGMLLSEKELSLSENHEGIVEYSEAKKPGDSVFDPKQDTYLEIGITPNLSHCFSVVGIARELCKVLPLTLKKPMIPFLEGQKEQSCAVVTITDPKSCPLYSFATLKGVTVTESPAWLKERLEAAGIRPVNTVVDAINYGMLEMGQPMHAFDLDALPSKKLSVERAKAGSKLLTIDHKERVLGQEDLVIASGGAAVALAGVMGGSIAEVTFESKNIFIESAVFDPKVVRKMARAHTLHSESSKRFERGVDPKGAFDSLKRVLDLLLMLTKGSLGQLDQIFAEKPPVEREISLRLSRVQKILGHAFSVSDLESILKATGYPFKQVLNDTYVITPPLFRHDLKEEIDLIEEIAIVFGYDNIAEKEPCFRPSRHPDAPMYLFENRVREKLTQEGLQEWITSDLLSEEKHKIVEGEIMSKEASIEVLNPNSIDAKVLRLSLLPNFLSCLKLNKDQGNVNLQVFEIGRVHFKVEGQYKEQSMAACLLTGQKQGDHFASEKELVDFYDCKGIVENLFHALNLKKPSFHPSQSNLFHPERQAALFIDDVEVGILGEIHPQKLFEFGIKEKVYYFEGNLHDLMAFQIKGKRFLPPPQFPGSTRDLTLTIESKTPFSLIEKIIEKIPSTLLETVLLIDCFPKNVVNETTKNLTLRFLYRHPKKTITGELVDKEHERIQKELTLKLNHLLHSHTKCV